MMSKGSETRKINAKVSEWDIAIRSGKRYFLKWWRPVWSEFKYSMKQIINWYWFNNEKSDGGKALHIIMWLLVTRALIRLWWGV